MRKQYICSHFCVCQHASAKSTFSVNCHHSQPHEIIGSCSVPCAREDFPNACCIPLNTKESTKRTFTKIVAKKIPVRIIYNEKTWELKEIIADIKTSPSVKIGLKGRPMGKRSKT